MQLDKSITVGNIVSWAMILIGLAVGYGKLESATAQNAKDVKVASDLAHGVQADLRSMDRTTSDKITELKVAVAETKATVNAIDKKLDVLINTRRDRQE
jgi:hypothetical protein